MSSEVVPVQFLPMENDLEVVKELVDVIEQVEEDFGDKINEFHIPTPENISLTI